MPPQILSWLLRAVPTHVIACGTKLAALISPLSFFFSRCCRACGRVKRAESRLACAQNSTSFLSEPIFNNSFPPGLANLVNTNFRLASEVLYPLEILYTVRSRPGHNLCPYTVLLLPSTA